MAALWSFRHPVSSGVFPVLGVDVTLGQERGDMRQCRKLFYDVLTLVGARNWLWRQLTDRLPHEPPGLASRQSPKCETGRIFVAEWPEIHRNACQNV